MWPELGQCLESVSHPSAHQFLQSRSLHLLTLTFAPQRLAYTYVSASDFEVSSEALNPCCVKCCHSRPSFMLGLSNFRKLSACSGPRGVSPSCEKPPECSCSNCQCRKVVISNTMYQANWRWSEHLSLKEPIFWGFSLPVGFNSSAYSNLIVIDHLIVRPEEYLLC